MHQLYPCDATCFSTVLVDIPLFELWFLPLVSMNHSSLFTLSDPFQRRQPYITKESANLILGVTCLLTVLLGLALVKSLVMLISAVFLCINSAA